MAYSKENEKSYLEAIGRDSNNRKLYEDYATYLESVGDGRAETIRTELAYRAEKQPLTVDRTLKDSREAYDRHHKEWMEPLKQFGIDGGHFHNGVPSSVLISPKDFAEHGEAILEIYPQLEIRLLRARDTESRELLKTAPAVGKARMVVSGDGADMVSLMQNPGYDKERVRNDDWSPMRPHYNKPHKIER